VTYDKWLEKKTGLTQNSSMTSPLAFQRKCSGNNFEPMKQNLKKDSVWEGCLSSKDVCSQ
jgi:hypothetical protein